MFSDIETKRLPVKGLRIGDSLEWQTRTTTVHPDAPGQFWGEITFVNGPVVLE